LIFLKECNPCKRKNAFVILQLRSWKLDVLSILHLIWILDIKFLNKGYATEGAKACLNYAFYTIHPPEVLSIVIAVNKPSLNVTKKIGMVKYLDFVHPKHKEYERLKNFVCCRIENKS
tara:strand:- start:28247 stop:28600 length:354 start_codon:yes stop_codon:yes gene_type:complete